MKQSTKKIINYSYILLTIFILLFLGIMNKDFHNAIKAIFTLNLKWVLLCFLVAFIYFFLEGYITYKFLKAQDANISLMRTVRITTIGLYYSAITPSSSGGEPAQVYYYSKYGVPVASSTSALSFKFFCFQLAVIVLAIGSVFGIINYICLHLFKMIPLVIIGILINSLYFFILALVYFKKSFLHWCIKWGIKIGSKLRLIKKTDIALQKATKVINDFYKNFTLLKSNTKLIFPMILISFVQVLAKMSVICFIYKAFGYKSYSLFTILCLQLVLHVCVSFAPLPGASGAQEVGFYVFFKRVFPKGQLFITTLIWRFFTYYLSLIIGGFLVALDSFNNTKEKKTIMP